MIALTRLSYVERLAVRLLLTGLQLRGQWLTMQLHTTMNAVSRKSGPLCRYFPVISTSFDRFSKLFLHCVYRVNEFPAKYYATLKESL